MSTCSMVEAGVSQVGAAPSRNHTSKLPLYYRLGCSNASGILISVLNRIFILASFMQL